MRSFTIFASENEKNRTALTAVYDKHTLKRKLMNQKEAIARLTEHGIKPSVQRIAIMQYLLSHFTHPTVDDVYRGLCSKIPTLSRTTVYNTLRMFSEHSAAQMITIDDHRVCYDGDISAHAHFYCIRCRKVYDIFDEVSPLLATKTVGGHSVSDVQLYYRGVCHDCMEKDAAENAGSVS